MKTPLFYKPKPVFGIDIGHGVVKVVQLNKTNKGKTGLGGYGYYSFPSSAIDNQGVITDIESVAKAAHTLIEKHMVGAIMTDRITATIPSARTFTRILTLPPISDDDLEKAVYAEAEQYIPVPIEDLYIDYELTKKGEKENEVLIVATPKQVVDSYLRVFDALGLEVSAIEPSLTAITRAISQAQPVDGSVLVVDFGSLSSDLSIFDGRNVRVTGTSRQGGDDLTSQLVAKLNITKRQAFHGKARYGIKQNTKQGREIYTHAKPILENLVTEIKKLIRYYKRLDDSRDIDAILLLGGGANLPGLDEFIAKQTGMKVLPCNPWSKIQIGDLQAPNPVETALYTTAVGSALLNPDSETNL